MRTQYLPALLFSGLATACPLAGRQQATATAVAPGAGASGAPGGGSGVDMAAAILAIMPKSSQCDPGQAQFPKDCRTAEQAAPFVKKAHAEFTPAETAAMLALMALESEEFKFKHNLVNAGQGTANMMMPNFIKEYATDLFGAEAASKTADELLEMVIVDEHNFASAAWFYKKKCASAQASLKTGTDAGWMAYMSCVGVPGGDSRRMEYWNRAKKAFNL